MLLEKKYIHVNLHEIGLDNYFLNMTSKGQETENWTSLKLKTFVIQRTLLRRKKKLT